MKKLIDKIIYPFDKLEDKTRAYLSKRAMAYAFLGGIGVVLFWRGVWHMADDFGLSSFGSVVVGIVILLVTGLFVSALIGDQVIISGLRGEKKVTEKTKEELEEEMRRHIRENEEIKSIDKRLGDIEKEMKIKEHSHS